MIRAKPKDVPDLHGFGWISWGRWKNAKNTKNTKNMRNSLTHTNPIQSILTLVARWTTPIESPWKRHEAEFPERDWDWRG